MGDIEVNTLQGSVTAAGPMSSSPPDVELDLLVHIESGFARHTVDFTDYSFGAGDVLWVRAGQVHQWGAIADIEGRRNVQPHAVNSAPGPHPAAPGPPTNHWPAADLTGTPVLQALALSDLSGNDHEPQTTQVYARSRLPFLAALFVQLALVEPSRRAAPRPTHRPTPGSATTSRSSSGAGSRSASTPTGGLLHPHPQPPRPTAHRPVSKGAHRRARRTRGKRQLSHADASVSEIAEQLGFDDASNFSSYFRRQTLLTPGTFRTQSRSAGTHSQQP